MTYKLALITGASSGIGAAYAREFAKRGTDVILVARRKDSLEALAKELIEQHSVAATVIVSDLSEAGATEKLMKQLSQKSLEPDMLINNAGFGTAGRVEKENRARVQDEIQVNIAALTDLTAAMLPKLLKRNEGAIVNIASTAAFQPVPGMAVYAATKAFVLSFTSAIWGEIQGSKVRVLAVCPGATATEFFEVAGSKSFGKMATVSDVINETFKALEAKKSKPAVVVGSQNRLMAGFSSRLPKAMVVKVAGSMFLDK
jgi:short-subunit dehydrogenase